MSGHYERASVLYDQGSYELALKEYQLALADDPNCPRTTTMIACCYEALSKVDEALSWAKKAVALDPERSLAYHILGRSLYRKRGLLDKEVKAAFFNAIKCDPTDIQSYSYMASIHSARREWKEALRWTGVASQYRPDNARCMALSGWSQFHLGETAEAEKLLVESLRLDPNVSAPHRYLAHVEIIKGDMSRAREHITEAHRIDPTPVVESYSYQTSYQYTSHDLMCEIVKADGTLYGKWLTVVARLNHQALVFEGKFGTAWTVALIVGGLVFLSILSVVLNQVESAITDWIAGIIGLFMLMLLVLPTTIWYAATGRMMLKRSTRKYVTKRQAAALILVPSIILLVVGMVTAGVRYSDQQEADIKTALLAIKQLEDKGDFRGASERIKKLVHSARDGAVSGYRTQRAAHDAGLPLESPEKNKHFDDSQRVVMDRVIDESYKQLYAKAGDVIEKDPELKQLIDADRRESEARNDKPLP